MVEGSPLSIKNNLGVVYGNLPWPCDMSPDLEGHIGEKNSARKICLRCVQNDGCQDYKTMILSCEKLVVIFVLPVVEL